MAKLTKDELLTKISEKISDEDLSIELMEDISDSLGIDEESIKAEYEAKISELSEALEEAKRKYKERFLKGEDKEEAEEEETKEETEELEEKEVIDVEEI